MTYYRRGALDVGLVSHARAVPRTWSTRHLHSSPTCPILLHDDAPFVFTPLGRRRACDDPARARSRYTSRLHPRVVAPGARLGNTLSRHSRPGAHAERDAASVRPPASRWLFLQSRKRRMVARSVSLVRLASRDREFRRALPDTEGTSRRAGGANQF